MTMKQLRGRATSSGIGYNQIEDARDSGDPTGELIRLIVAQQTPPGQTRAELQVLGTKELRAKSLMRCVGNFRQRD